MSEGISTPSTYSAQTLARPNLPIKYPNSRITFCLALGLILKHANEDAIDNAKVSVDDLYAVLLTDYRLNGKCLSWAELNWNKHLKPFFGGRLAKNVGTDMLARYIESRHKKKRCERLDK